MLGLAICGWGAIQMKKPKTFIFKTDHGWRLRIVLFNKFMFYLVIAKGADHSQFQ